MTTTAKILTLLGWVVASMAIIYKAPIWFGVLYATTAIIAAQLIVRRRDRQRRAELAAAADTQRVGDPKTVSRGPSNRGFGVHSWVSRPDDGTDYTDARG